MVELEAHGLGDADHIGAAEQVVVDVRCGLSPTALTRTGKLLSKLPKIES
jgi:hypothetical protein